MLQAVAGNRSPIAIGDRALVARRTRRLANLGAKSHLNNPPGSCEGVASHATRTHATTLIAIAGMTGCAGDIGVSGCDNRSRPGTCGTNLKRMARQSAELGKRMEAYRSEVDVRIAQGDVTTDDGDRLFKSREWQHARQLAGLVPPRSAVRVGDFGGVRPWVYGGATICTSAFGIGASVRAQVALAA